MFRYLCVMTLAKEDHAAWRERVGPHVILEQQINVNRFPPSLSARRVAAVRKVEAIVATAQKH